jgi:hypothetical protein
MIRANQRCSEGEFIELLEKLGAAAAARKLGLSERAIHSRRRRLEKNNRILIKVPPSSSSGKISPTAMLEDHPARRQVKLKDGVILVGSDSHYWPNIISTAHRAFVHFNRELKPNVVIKNGDELDFPRISRHAPIQWENQPSVVMEIEAATDRLHEITEANKNAEYYWPLGNHDARYETKLATVAPEYAKVKGVHLKDHFPRWKPCWSVWINDDVVIKHRWANGIHAVYNNAVRSGKTMVTGHLHSLKVTPWSDYTGTRFGVDCGTMADPYGPQFEGYMEDNARNWRSGFVVLTFNNSKLLWPELVHVIDEKNGLVEFRGKVIKV